MMARNKSSHIGVDGDIPKFTILLFILVCVTMFARGQSNDTLQTDKKRLRLFAYTSSAAYTATMAGLYHVWYKNTERQSFELFNDNAEWKQVDKAGHIYSSFYLSYATYRAMRWSHIAEKKSAMIGAITGFLVMLPIEVFDGFSARYGASTGDLIGNAGGAIFFLGQQTLWSEVRIIPKFSFHRTPLAQRRPETLGANLFEELVKDYNGQTYWISVDMDKFMPFPRWLNLALGYGAHDMVYARDEQNHQNHYYPYRQLYVSLDFDLTSLQPRSKLLKAIITIANTVKIPAPTIEFSRKNRLHWVYF